MKKLFEFIDANPDCMVLPTLVIIIALLIAGIHHEVEKFKTEPNRSAIKGLLLIFATMIVMIIAVMYVSLLIFDAWN